MSYFPLIIFHTILCPLYNSKTVRDISMQLGTLIKQDEMMCHAMCPLYNSKTVRDISMQLGTLIKLSC